MDTVAEAVEIFQGPGGTLRCRLVIGWALIGGQLFHMEKRGGVRRLTAEECEDQYGGDWALFQREATVELRAAAVRTWDVVPSSGELVTPVYAWQLGAPYETDDDGEILGDWPVIGYLTLTYTEKFLMPGGQLPDGYQSLRHWRLGRNL